MLDPGKKENLSGEEKWNLVEFIIEKKAKLGRRKNRSEA